MLIPKYPKVKSTPLSCCPIPCLGTSAPCLLCTCSGLQVSQHAGSPASPGLWGDVALHSLCFSPENLPMWCGLFPPQRQGQVEGEKEASIRCSLLEHSESQAAVEMFVHLNMCLPLTSSSNSEFIAEHLTRSSGPGSQRPVLTRGSATDW